MNDLIYEINSDLKIKKLADEDDTSFKARITYSAMSFWVRRCTFDSLGDKGISSKHITSRCSEVLENIVESYPEIKDWFFINKNNINYPIIKIRKRLIASSEIKYINFNKELRESKYQELELMEGKLLRGYCENKGLIISGLGYFKDISDIQDEELVLALNFYYIDRISAKEKLQMKIENIEWQNRKKSNIEVFNSRKRSILSNSFEDNYNLNEGELSVYREGNYGYDYGFIKKEEGEYWFSPIGDYEREQKEVRRYQYALRDIYGNKEKARYKFIKGSNAYRLKLFSRLPNQEESILFLLGWPCKNIDDFCNLIFPREIWKLIEGIIKNLNINLIEEK